jgi:hypothetical protein
VGPFNGDPSVAGRMAVFDASINQLLWPAQRERDSILGSRVPGTIDRTDQRSEIIVPAGFVPEVLQPLRRVLHRLVPSLGGDITLGPIPKGMPVSLLSNLKLQAEDGGTLAHKRDLAEVLVKLPVDLFKARNAPDAELREKFANLRAPLMRLSKCPDFVVNRGHYFGTAEFNQQEGLSADEKAFGTEPELSDADKRALIAFLKTF